MEVSLIVTLFLMNYFHCKYLVPRSFWCISPKLWSSCPEPPVSSAAVKILPC